MSVGDQCGWKIHASVPGATGPNLIVCASRLQKIHAELSLGPHRNSSAFERGITVKPTSAQEQSKSKTDKPALLEHFKVRHNLESLQRVANDRDLQGQFLFASLWVKNRIEACRRDLAQLVNRVREATVIEDRATLQALVLERATIQVEISELESVAQEIDLCITPGRIAGQQARRAWEQQRNERVHQDMIRLSRY